MWVKARGQTRYVVYSMGGAMLLKASGQTCYLPHLSGRCSTRKSERSDTRYVIYHTCVSGRCNTR